jgi:hypothetical protein
MSGVGDVVCGLQETTADGDLHHESAVTLKRKAGS